MSDELDEVKRMFRAEAPIVPRRAVQDQAIARALECFEQENSRVRQGTSLGLRLKRRVGALIQSLKGFSMPSLRLNQALLAGTSLAVLTLVVVNTGIVHHGLRDTSEPLMAPDVAIEPNQAAIPMNKEIGAKQVAEPKREEADDQIATNEPSAKPKLMVKPAEGVAAHQRSFAARSGKIGADQPRTLGQSNAIRRVIVPGQADLDAGTYAAPAPMAEKAIGVAPPTDQAAPYYHDQGRDKFTEIKTNPVKIVKDEPVSTFSIDVDTSSYGFMRAALNQNTLPQKHAVRVEEMINYFPYDYAGPADKAEPFKATATVFPTPWNADTKLLHIGIKGFALNGQEKPRANLVFLVDTSGSMNEPAKLPLLINSMKLLTEALDPEDTISIVTYAGSAGTMLAPTKVKDKAKIVAALDLLHSGGSTAGAEGIRQAYQLAEQSFDKTGVNRVILATDGDFNVGITDPEELKSFVERKRASGVFLSVLGFGRGNYNDALMQTLAQNGNGNAAYIDTLNEARKVLVDEATSTLFPIAKDVKIQIEFNPQTVAEYRLIGYETRLLNREDFNNDKVDAGDIGAGHTVTAIYEITPRGSKGQLNDELRYSTPAAEPSASGEYAFLKLRYKLPNSDSSKLIESPITDANELADLAGVPQEQRFATAVAAFGQLLSGDQYTRSFSYDDVIDLAQAAKGADPFGYRAEFVNLVRLAKTAQALEPLKP